MKYVYCKNKLSGLTLHCCIVHVLVKIEFKFFATSLNASSKCAEKGCEKNPHVMKFIVAIKREILIQGVSIMSMCRTNGLQL